MLGEPLRLTLGLNEGLIDGESDGDRLTDGETLGLTDNDKLGDKLKLILGLTE